MGIVGVESNRKAVKNPSSTDIGDVVTQIIDDCHRLSPGDKLQDEEGNDFIHLSSAMAIDDDYLLEGGFETQVVNITTQVINYAGETQVMDDYVGETQVMDDYVGETQVTDDYVGETQAMDDYVGETQALDCADETQVMDLSGGTQVMDLLGETQVMDVAAYETQKIDRDGETQALGDVDTSAYCFCPNGDATKMHDDVSGTSPVIASNKDHSGSDCRDFTSIRAASFRASGLAARARGADRTLSGTNTGKSSLACIQGSSSIADHLLQHGTRHMEDYPQNENSEGNDKLETAHYYRYKNTVVRKLFLDDQVTECVQSEDDVNLNGGINDNVNSQTSCQNNFGGLSYANSQEPGELSQAEALKAVDKFLSLTVENDNSDFFGFRVHDAGKPKAVTTAKGSRELAKASIFKRTDGQKGIYDWDDNSEDEYGGELFQRKKELFFESKSSMHRTLPKARKTKGHHPKFVKNVAAHENEERQTSEKNDSRLMSRRPRAKRKTLHSEEVKLPKILSKEFDQDLETYSMQHLESNDSNSKEVAAHVETVGPDTQIAAEAMENLCFEFQLAGNCNIAAHNKGTGGTANATRKSQSTAKERLAVEGRYNSNGAVTRLARRRNTAVIKSSNECSVPFPSEKSKNARKRACREQGLTGKNQQANVNVTLCHEVEPHLDTKPLFCSPVASRTRNRFQISCYKAVIDSSNGGEEFTDMISARVTRKRRTSAKYENVESNTVTKVRKFGPTGFAKSRASDVDAIGPKQNGKITHAATSLSAGNGGTSGNVETSPQEICKASAVNCNTPPASATLINGASPICMGDEYHKQSCRRNPSRPSLVKEINRLLVDKTPESYARTKDLRKRKDIGNVRILFSQHLDDDIVKQQQKILARLGGTVASSILDATHFVADEFVRTRNMLEAIAFGKSVVTHLWLDSCGQASCLIDEKNYILRDAKKEKEFGFSLPASLSRARQHPLLQGHKVFITPNTKPGKSILSNLVKAVHGLVVERLGRSVSNNEKHPDDLLVLSCEDDYDICIPFLKKGGSVYSSELLLNGIVKQKLEHQRHLLFADNVKRTRSTIWLKRNDQYLPAKETM